MQKHSLVSSFRGFWALVLHTLRVHVRVQVPKYRVCRVTVLGGFMGLSDYVLTSGL